MNEQNCICLKCTKEMHNFAETGLQPSGGLAFMTRGHYGSTYFDPMDGTSLEIAVCDECIRSAVNTNIAYPAYKPIDSNYRFPWTKGASLPEPFLWFSDKTSDYPEIWAAKSKDGWRVQFAYGEQGIEATGTGRQEAAEKLVSQFRVVSD
jgi:hypothetical protein